MKLLIVCDKGINRSVTLAGQLKFMGHDVLTAGTDTNSFATLKYLVDWADRVIITDRQQAKAMELVGAAPVLFDIGPDVYPRPYNKDLLAICKRLIVEHPLG